MLKLKQVLPSSAEAEIAPPLLDAEVIGVRLNTGAPCSGHAEAFETWPGAGENVREWFILDNGKAVAVDERADGPPAFPIVEYSGQA